MEELNNALGFIRSQFDDSDMDAINYAVCKKMNEHVSARRQFPELADRVQDLLEEYGDDHDFPEGWWLEYGDIDDIIDQL